MFVALRICIFAGLLACVPFAAVAQVPSSEQPGRERQRFIEQPVAKAKLSGPTISLTGTAAPQGAGTLMLTISDIRVVGATVYSAADLQPLYASIIGHRLPLAEVYAVAQKITAKYGSDGYVLSRAIVPPQNLDPKGAVVTIRVIEGYVDRVEWPASLKRDRDFFSDYSAKITAQRPANIKTVMRYLLLAGDLPGIDVTSRFQPSSTDAGASTLVVEATTRPIDADARIDNRGTEARGPWEYQASVTLNNLLGQHEAITGTIAGAVQTSELQYLAVGYRQVLTSEGLTGFVDASYSWGKPGTATLQALDFGSKSLAADAGFSLPLIRSREKNLTVSGLVFLSNDEGDILSAPSSVDRLRGFRLKAEGDATDRLNGTNQFSTAISQGIDGLGGTENGNPLASRENGRVDFTKIEASISRVQPLKHGFSFRGALQGQYAFTPLLAPEECGYGGKDMGRAFDPSEITGDRCWSASAELRFDVPGAPKPFTMQQLYAFVDYGSVYRIAPSLGTPTRQDGSSAGIGFRLGTDHFSADISAVKPLSGRTDDGWRYFLSASAHY